MTVVRRWIAPFLASLAGVWAVLGAAGMGVQPPGPEPVSACRNASARDLGLDDATPWTALLLSDVQNGFSYLPEVFRRAAAYKPAAIFVTGDFSGDHDDLHAQLPVWAIRRAPPPAPLFVLPGNHDIERATGAGRDAFLRYYGSLGFDVTIGSTRFIGVPDCGLPLNAEDLSALEAQLKDAATHHQRVVLCLHHDVIDWEGKAHQRATPENVGLQKLIDEYAIAFVLCGHYHTPHDEIRGSTRYIVAPASGHRDQAARIQTPVSFLLLRWTGRALVVEREQFSRDNATDIRGVFVHLSLAHLQPLGAGVVWTSVVVGALLCIAGWWWRRGA